MNTTTPSTNIPTGTNSSLNLGLISNPRAFHQLAIIGLDGSGSMSDMTSALITKAEATDLATRELITRFKASSAKNNFSFGVLTFDTSAQLRMQPTECAQIDEYSEDFNPLRGHGGGTDIGSLLLEAERVANDFLAVQSVADGVPTDVVILLMSDGGHNTGPDARVIADRIKASNGGRVTICAALFATVGTSDPAGEALLRSLVSDPTRGFSTLYTPEALRDFFKASLVRASGVQLK